MRRILWIRSGALGDFIITLPALAALRERWPDAHIELLGYPRFGELALRPARPWLDAARSVDRGPLAGFFIQTTVLDPDWCDYFSSFDAVISCFADPDETFSKNLRQAGVKELLPISPFVTTEPAARHFCEPLRKFGIDARDFTPFLPIQESEKAMAAAALPAGTGPLIAIHPGSGSPAKNWPVDRWIDLSRAWLHDPANRLLIIAGESDREHLPRLRAALPGGRFTTAENLPLPGVAALLACCPRLIGHDSGISHLAAAVGTPVIALFGPTDPKIWAPQGENVTVLQRDYHIDQITVDDVLNILT